MFAARLTLAVLTSAVLVSAAPANSQYAVRQNIKVVTFPDGRTNCGYDLDSWDGYQNWVAAPEWLANGRCGAKVVIQSDRGQSTGTLVSIGTGSYTYTDVSEQMYHELGYTYAETPAFPGTVYIQ